MFGARELGLVLLLLATCDAAADRPAPPSVEPPPLMEGTVVEGGAPHTADPLPEAASERPPTGVEVEHEQPGGDPPASDDSLVPPPAQASEPEPAPLACCRTCHEGKACGDSCIARTSTCTKPPGCACDG